MNIWITTDTHFSHAKLIDYGRPADFEDKIKRNIKLSVSNSDILIHLGDVCIGNEAVNNEWFRSLGARRYLVLGNHDTKSIKWYLEHGWDFVSERFDFKMFGKRISFSHMPIAWDGYFDMNIHGHFHDTDGRRHPEHNNDILSGYNKLLALEYTDYKPVNLKNFICQPTSSPQ